MEVDDRAMYLRRLQSASEKLASARVELESAQRDLWAVGFADQTILGSMMDDAERSIRKAHIQLREESITARSWVPADA